MHNYAFTAWTSTKIIVHALLKFWSSNYWNRWLSTRWHPKNWLPICTWIQGSWSLLLLNHCSTHWYGKMMFIFKIGLYLQPSKVYNANFSSKSKKNVKKQDAHRHVMAWTHTKLKLVQSSIRNSMIVLKTTFCPMQPLTICSIQSLLAITQYDSSICEKAKLARLKYLAFKKVVQYIKDFVRAMLTSLLLAMPLEKKCTKSFDSWGVCHYEKIKLTEYWV